MTQEAELPALPIWHTVGCGDLNGQKVLTKPEVIAYATAAVLAERERFANRLRYEMDFDGFGCACEPAHTCATCRARDVLQKALTPLVKELTPPAVKEG